MTTKNTTHSTRISMLTQQMSCSTGLLAALLCLAPNTLTEEVLASADVARKREQRLSRLELVLSLRRAEEFESGALNSLNFLQEPFVIQADGSGAMGCMEGQAAEFDGSHNPHDKDQPSEWLYLDKTPVRERGQVQNFASWIVADIELPLHVAWSAARVVAEALRS